MIEMKPLKSAMLAAASFAALGAATPASANAPIEPIAVEHAMAADHADPEARAAAKAVNGWLLGGAVAAALAGLVRLFGWSRISAALRKAGAVAASAPAAAVRVVGEAVKSPLRSLAIIGGLSLFALTGVGFYDVEWAAGLATGAALTLAGVVGVRRIGHLFARR
jgi:hypothetical protein